MELLKKRFRKNDTPRKDSEVDIIEKNKDRILGFGSASNYHLHGLDEAMDNKIATLASTSQILTSKDFPTDEEVNFFRQWAGIADFEIEGIYTFAINKYDIALISPQTGVAFFPKSVSVFRGKMLGVIRAIAGVNLEDGSEQTCDLPEVLK